MYESRLRDVDVRETRSLRRERLVHRALVIRVENVAASSGVGFVQQEVVIARDVCCFAQPISGSLQPTASGQDVAQSNYRVEFDVDAGVLPKHRLYITGTSGCVAFGPKRLGVMTVNIPRGQAVALSAGCTDNIDEAGSGPPPG